MTLDEKQGPGIFHKYCLICDIRHTVDGSERNLDSETYDSQTETEVIDLTSHYHYDVRHLFDKYFDDHSGCSLFIPLLHRCLYIFMHTASVCDSYPQCHALKI